EGSSAVARAPCAGVCFGLRPDAVRTRCLRHAGNATSGSGALGCETRHAGERYLVPLAEMEWHAVREGILQGIARDACRYPWLCALGQLLGGHGCPSIRARRGLLRATSAR